MARRRPRSRRQTRTIVTAGRRGATSPLTRSVPLPRTIVSFVPPTGRTVVPQAVRSALRGIRAISAGPSETLKRYKRVRDARIARSFRDQRDRMLNPRLHPRSDICTQRRDRRRAIFYVGAGGVSGPSWSRMMRHARHRLVSHFACRR